MRRGPVHGDLVGRRRPRDVDRSELGGGRERAEFPDWSAPPNCSSGHHEVAVRARILRYRVLPRGHPAYPELGGDDRGVIAIRRAGRMVDHLSLIHISEPTRLLSISYA